MSRKLQRGGYIADFSTTADANSYMLYNPPAADNTAALASAGITTTDHPGTPGLKNLEGGGNLELSNGFYYSIDGGCALCASTTTGGGNNKKTNRRRGGVGLELAPFISALALLGARLLADDELGMFNAPAPSSSKKGGSNPSSSRRRKN